jgi:DNA invertase Pin-like site-specific DNA recombinase
MKIIKSPSRAIGYIRVSSLEQVEDGESLKRQEEQIRAYCKMKEIESVEVIADRGISGFKSNRPGFQRLVELCKAKEVSTVIVYDLSRLSRNVRTTLEFIEDIIVKNNLSLISLRESIDTESAAGKAFLTISMVFAQLFRDQISERTKAAIQHKKSKMERTGGHLPYGFAEKNGKLIPLEQEQQVIALVNELRDKGYSLTRIVAELHQRRIPAKNGGRWYAQTVKNILGTADQSQKRAA